MKFLAPAGQLCIRTPLIKLWIVIYFTEIFHLKFAKFLGRYGEAQNIANDLLRSDGTNADAMFVRGLCLYYEDFVDKAFSHFQQVLRLAPDHQQAKDTYKVTNRIIFWPSNLPKYYPTAAFKQIKQIVQRAIFN